MPTVSQGIYRWLFQRGASLEDFADRLNHFWTSALLLLFAAIISWKQGVSDPIRCWQPAEFTRSFVDYVHTECWNKHTIQYPRDLEEAAELLNTSIQGPFDVLFRMPLPLLADIRDADDMLWLTSATTTFYQWLPLYLAFQALLFKLPNLLLYLVHGYSGISFNKLSGLTDGYGNLNTAERSSLAKQISRYIYHWCNQCECPLPWRYLTCAWLITKLLFIINIVTQMFYLDSFLRTTDPPFDNSTSYGDVIKDNLFSNNGSLWKQSPKFPRKVFCDFSIRQLFNINRFTVQCQLPMNEFTEAVYIFLWVWFMIVAVVTPVSFAVWIVRTALPIFRRRYVGYSLLFSVDISRSTNF